MGKPGQGHAWSSHTEYIGVGGELGELKHLSTRRKGNRRDSLSSGERNGNRPNRREAIPSGVVGLRRGTLMDSGMVWKGRPKRVTAPYAKS